MARIRALLLRQYLVSGKTLLLKYLSLILMFVLLALFQLSCRIGNMQSLFAESSASEVAFTISSLNLFLMLYMSLSAGISDANAAIITADIKTNWMCYSYTLPIRGLDRAAAHIIFRASDLLVSFSLLFGYYAVSCAINGEAFTGSTILTLLIPLAGAMIFMLIYDAFQYRSRTAEDHKKNRAYAYGILFAVFAAALMGFGKKISVFFAGFIQEMQEYEEANPIVSGDFQLQLLIKRMAEGAVSLRDALIPWVIPVILLCFVLDFLIVRKMSERSDLS